MTRAEFRTLWGLTAGERTRYALAIVAMGLTILFLFGVPLVPKAVIDAFIAESPPTDPTWLDALAGALREAVSVEQALLVSAGAIILLTAVAGVLTYLRTRWAAEASEAITRRLRNRLYQHLERLPATEHDHADTGDLVQRCTSDVETIRIFLSAQVIEIARASLFLVLVIPFLFWLHVKLALVSLALYPVIIAFAVIFFRKVKKVFLETDEAEGAMTSVLQENLTGIRVVRAFARQAFEMEKFADKNEVFRDCGYRLVRLLGLFWALSDFVCFLQLGLVLFFGSSWAIQGELTVGTLFAIITYNNIVIWPVRHMGRVLTDSGKAVVSIGRLHEILNVAPEQDHVAPLEPTSALADFDGSLEFRGVDFAFGEGPRVLTDVSFRLNAGETLAVVGPPGSGKSTIVNLLLRLYDYETGSILLGGHELQTLPRQLVRGCIGAVLQEPFLYSKTVLENLRLGRSGASREETESAAKAAAVHSTVGEFSNGYDTAVGERGVTLSGGQRQRLALARALLKDAPLLILDDAMSAVDTRTEADILGALKADRRERSTLMISHRLSSIRHADRVLLLNSGSIVECGTHEELLAGDGPYQRLWALQSTLEKELLADLRPPPPGAAS